MGRLVNYGLFIVCFFCVQLKAYIYDVRVMRRWDHFSRNYKYFIGLGDYHDKKHRSIPKQKQKIENIVSRCNRNETKIIIEDVSSLGSNGCKGCGNFFVNSSGGLLGGMAEKYEKVCEIDNIEYRFCRVASLAPVINNLNSDFRAISSTSKIPVKRLYDEVMGTVDEINKYNDGQLLNNWYKECINDAMQAVNLFKLDKYANLSVANYIYAITNRQNRLPFIKKFLTFDRLLIDSKIVHSVIDGKNKKMNIVVAGGSHVKIVSEILQKAGYEMVHQTNVKFRKEYDNGECLGCNVMPGGFCYKPEAADLSVLNRYF